MARAFRCMESRLLSSPRSVCAKAGAVANAHRKAHRTRQRRILEALADARDALTEALRVDFGERYELLLSISDREGWPMLELHLIDTASEFLPGIKGTVKDSMSTGALEQHCTAILFVSLNHGEAVAHLNVDEDCELAGLPELLIENVALFMERISADKAVTEHNTSVGNSGHLLLAEEDAELPLISRENSPHAGPISRPEADAIDDKLLDLNFHSDC